MAKQTLPTNFKDDILGASMGGKRRYNLIQNSNGTVSLEDVTSYTQVGSDFGAAQMNQTNKAVNESCDKANVIDDLDDIMANQANGKIAGAKAVATLNADLSELQKAEEVTPAWGSGTSAVEWSCICKNNRVSLNAIVDKTQTIPANTQWKICTIPSGYRPAEEIMLPIVINKKSAIGTIRWASVRIDPDGSVYIISTADIDTSWYIRLSAAWDI